MKKYRHIFFDLDHTIWDFDKNAEEALQELYIIYRLKEIGLSSADVFIETYTCAITISFGLITILVK